MCKLLHKLFNFLYSFFYFESLSLFCRDLPLFKSTHLCVKSWPKKLRSGKSFDKYHVQIRAESNTFNSGNGLVQPLYSFFSTTCSGKIYLYIYMIHGLYTGRTTKTVIFWTQLTSTSCHWPILMGEMITSNQGNGIILAGIEIQNVQV